MVKKQEAVKEAIKVQNLQEQANKQKFIADAQVKERASIEEAKRIKTIADANFYKAQKQADASVYKIKNTAKAENYATKQQADAAKYLSEQIGKEVVGSLMVQDKINEAAEKFKVPSTIFISGKNGSKEAIDLVSAHMISNSIKKGLKTIK